MPYKKSAAQMGLSFCLAIVLGFYPIGLPASAASGKRGDPDGDGSITIADVMEVCKVMARQSAGTLPSADLLRACDLTGDDVVAIDDVMELCKILARGEALPPDDSVPDVGGETSSDVSQGGGEEIYPFGQSGETLMERIVTAYGSGDGHMVLERRGEEQPAFLWPYSTYVQATADVYKVAPDDAIRRARYMAALEGIEAYHTGRASPGRSYAASYGGAGDVYYDDNMWIALAFVEGYYNLKDPTLLSRARQVAEFCLSGWDEKLDGGIYWCESQKATKNTCSNAPMAMAAVRLFEATGNISYRRWSERIYAWTREKLRDPADGLYYDHLDLSGGLVTRKYACNAGCMLIAALELYDQTDQAAYLDDARQIAAAANDYFLQKQGDGYTLSTAGVGDPWFLTWLVEGYIGLCDWDEHAREYVDHLASATRTGLLARDGEGFVYSGWSDGVGNTADLIHQCGTVSVCMQLDAWSHGAE